jgi:hypothetical protein
MLIDFKLADGYLKEAKKNNSRMELIEYDSGSMKVLP